MKKMIIAFLMILAMTTTVTMTADIAFAHCGKCGIESSEKAGSSTSKAKKWYNPLSWFKKCSTCDLKGK